jgi:hypothetical protein
MSTDLQTPPIPDGVVDVSPVRALVELKAFECRWPGPPNGNRTVSYLTPLRGLKPGAPSARSGAFRTRNYLLFLIQSLFFALA